MSSSAAQRINKLREEIRKHDHAYYVLARPTISDRRYDQRFDELRRIEQQHPDLITPDSPTQRVGGEPIEGFEHVTHAVPMMSVDNTYNEDELREFDRRVSSGLGGDPYRFLVDPKIDGVAVSLLYEGGILARAATRGDGRTGDDVTGNIRTIKSVPLKLIGPDVPKLVDIRGEVYWPKSAFAEFNRNRAQAGEPTFANPRNAASGTLKQLDPRKVAGRGLQFIAHGVGRIEPLSVGTGSELFDLFQRWGIPLSSRRRLYESIGALISDLPDWQTQRLDLPYETDGLVVKVDALDQRDALGATSRHPRWCIAYKFEAQQAESILLQVDFQVGKFGTITPRAVMEPMQLSGTTVRHASLHNFDQVDRLDVRVGDTVIVEKAGEIIPQVVRVVLEKRPRGEPIKRPTKCPACKGLVEQDDGGVHIRCINPGACPAQLKERLIHFCGRDQMDINGAGRVVIETLVDKKIIKNYADLYNLDKGDENLAGLRLPDKPLGERAAAAMVQGIEKTRATPLDQILRTLRTRELTPETIARLSTRFNTLERILCASKDELLKSVPLNHEAAKRLWEFLHPAPPPELAKRIAYLAAPKRLGIPGLGEVRAAKLVEQARDVMRERVGELEFGAHPAFTLTADRLLDGEADWLEPELLEETNNE
ncbi:MAG: NAD-dependent DNA ligase LigA [Planctomycetes bacterium]|nr:NAD-dependent DNA ligase LigA [Planctomycetota bacterium]